MDPHHQAPDGPKESSVNGMHAIIDGSKNDIKRYGLQKYITDFLQQNQSLHFKLFSPLVTNYVPEKIKSNTSEIKQQSPIYMMPIIMIVK